MKSNSASSGFSCTGIYINKVSDFAHDCSLTGENLSKTIFSPSFSCRCAISVGWVHAAKERKRTRNVTMLKKRFNAILELGWNCSLEDCWDDSDD